MAVETKSGDATPASGRTTKRRTTRKPRARSTTATGDTTTENKTTDTGASSAPPKAATRQVDVQEVAGQRGNATSEKGGSTQGTVADAKSDDKAPKKRRSTRKRTTAKRTTSDKPATEADEKPAEATEATTAKKPGRRRRAAPKRTPPAEAELPKTDRDAAPPAARTEPAVAAPPAKEAPTTTSAGTTKPAETRPAASTGTDTAAPPRATGDQPSGRTGGRRRGRRRRGGGQGAAAAAATTTTSASPASAPARPAPAPRPKSDDDEEYLDVDVDVDADADIDTEEETDSDLQTADLTVRKKREMVINVTGQDECRIAILEDGRLEELFIERASAQSLVGNIYKGRVTNVEPSIQAAFIDFGREKNGFLHISDVQPQYFPHHTGPVEDVGRKIPRHHRPPIQKCFRRGQEVIVQVTKEGVGTKGPTLTSYLSIPGRFLVMMPGMSRHGVSRKIEDDAIRRSMRDLLSQLSLPDDMGFILRTAGIDRTKRELQRDLNYLLRLWKTVVDRIREQPAPAELYRESDLVTRTIRDVYTTDFDRMIIDDAGAARKARDLLRIAMPRTRPVIELFQEREPLFHRLGIEAEIERINMRHVPLRSGGSIVIDSTEALVAIDVNSGRFRSPDDAEETAVRINVEAADEIARQLRLRDLGGLIVCDFIDMRLDRNKRKVERALRDALKKHKERAKTLRMSAFGLIEMTRQRQGRSLKRSIYYDCSHCRGAGLVKMPESVILDVMRTLQLALHHKDVHRVTITVAQEVAYQLLNLRRAAIARIENDTGKVIVIRGDAAFNSDHIECLAEDSRGRPVNIGGSFSTEAPAQPGPRRS